MTFQEYVARFIHGKDSRDFVEPAPDWTRLNTPLPADWKEIPHCPRCGTRLYEIQEQTCSCGQRVTP